MNIRIIDGTTTVTCQYRSDMLKMIFAAKTQGYTYSNTGNGYALYNEDGYFAFYVKVNLS
jgi:hypothetical protein